MTTYSVVEFLEDNTVEAIPTSWINKDLCAWPITKNFSLIRKLIERKSIPNDVEFNYYKMKVLKTTGNKIVNNTIVFKYYMLHLGLLL